MKGVEPGRLRAAVVAALAILVGAAAPACVDPLLGPEPEPDSPAYNFELLWENFDRHYSFFGLKDVDWDDVRSRYRPGVREDMSDAELYAVVTAMLDELEDGHLNVYSPHGVYGWTGWYSGRPLSFYGFLLPGVLVGEPDVLQSTRWRGALLYGRAAVEPAGMLYIGIRSFEDGMSEGVDEILRMVPPEAGVILDVRSNGGGSDVAARRVAGRFVDERRLYRTVRVRNGPEHDDFTDPIPSYVEPAANAFTGPVVVLTNRRTYSAAESFILALRTRSAGVTVVGDTTGGGSGYPMHRELPNGWTYRLSRWIAYDADGSVFQDVGIAPDEVITFGEDATRDLILERAVELIIEAQGD